VSDSSTIREFFRLRWPYPITQKERIRRVSGRIRAKERTVEGWFCGGHRPSAVYRERLERAYPGLKNAT